MKYKLVIFDWDGTLMDSTERIVRCLARAAEETGLPLLPDERLRSIIGLGLPEAIRDLYPGIEDTRLQAMRGAYAGHFVIAEQTPSQLFPGAREMLDRLAGSSLRLAVATGKSRRGLDRVWANTDLANYFCASRCADESRSKPHPAMVHELLEQMCVPVQDALVVGDTSFDLEMARRAGVARVGVTWGAHPRERMQAFGPRALVDSFDELFSLITAPVHDRLCDGV